jgi:RNA 2',3'-cyclic 3'-phosphodiesterase
MLTHTTAVVVIPPAEVWPPIQALRQQHDRQYRRWMPHITLLYPFRPRADFAALAAQFAAACADLTSFDITLARFDTFRQPRQHYALWLAPEPQDALVALQAALWQVVPDCDATRRHAHGFTPHLSVGQARGSAAIGQTLAALQRSWTPLSFMISEVHLIWRNQPPDDVFRIGQSVRLGA